MWFVAVKNTCYESEWAWREGGREPEAKSEWFVRKTQTIPHEDPYKRFQKSVAQWPWTVCSWEAVFAPRGYTLLVTEQSRIQIQRKTAHTLHIPCYKLSYVVGYRLVANQIKFEPGRYTDHAIPAHTYKFWWENLWERDYLQDIGVDGIIILKRIKKWDKEAWTAFIWHLTGTGSGLL